MENSNRCCQLHVLEAGFSGRRGVSTPQDFQRALPCASTAGRTPGWRCGSRPASPAALPATGDDTTPPRNRWQQCKHLLEASSEIYSPQGSGLARENS